MSEVAITSYLGYRVTVYLDGMVVVAPNGDYARFESMGSVRRWVKRHRRLR